MATQTATIDPCPERNVLDSDISSGDASGPLLKTRTETISTYVRTEMVFNACEVVANNINNRFKL